MCPIPQPLGLVASLTITPNPRGATSEFAPIALAGTGRVTEVNPAPGVVEDMKLLTEVRNYLTHYGDRKSLGKNPLWSRQFYVLLAKVRLFMEVCLLGVLGFDDCSIYDRLRTFEPYLGWKDESHF